MSTHHKRCGVILYNPTLGKYLLVRGIDSKKWGFPKGHMEWGELEEQTAIREFEEETGLTVRAPFDTRLRFGNNIYFVKTQTETRQPCAQDTHEIDQVQWFALPEILALPKEQCNFGLSMWRKHILGYPDRSPKRSSSPVPVQVLTPPPRDREMNWFQRISIATMPSDASPSLDDPNPSRSPKRSSLPEISAACV